MKKLILISILLVLSVILGVDKVNAGGLNVYSVNLSTYPVSEAETLEVQLPGNKKIHRVLVTNSDRSITQTVTFYENATSTTSVKFSWEMDMASNANLNHIVDLPFEGILTCWQASNLAIRKSVSDSNVKVTIWYR